MPESADYYRGKKEALEEFYRNVGISDIAESAVWDRIRKAESDMSALPAPIEATPVLPRGKPLVYEDPSPDYWDLVEKCEAAIGLAINTVECASLDLRTGEKLPWYKTARSTLSAIQAARQARGK